MNISTFTTIFYLKSILTHMGGMPVNSHMQNRQTICLVGKVFLVLNMVLKGITNNLGRQLERI